MSSARRLFSINNCIINYCYFTFLHVFGLMLTSKNILEIDHLFELLCFVLCSERHTNENQKKFLELKNVLWEIVNLIMKSQKSLKLNR